MSQENVEPVRQKVPLRKRSGRTLEQRLAVRLPWFVELWSRLVARLSPTSRLRQALLLRSVQISFDAYSRGDLEVLVLPYHPDVEFQGPPDHGQGGTLGWRPSYRGHDGYREFYADWKSVWGAPRIEPQELIDLGDRLLVIAQMRLRGVGSGVRLNQDLAVLATLDEAGKVIRERRYADHSEALETVGLSEQDAHADS
jgi:ketosteroid isomerase-like protein